MGLEKEHEAERMVKVFNVLDKKYEQIQDIVDDIKIVAPKLIVERRARLGEDVKKDMEAANRFASLRLQEEKMGVGYKKICMECGHYLPEGGYKCFCTRPEIPKPQ
jgi:hypothetical protein